jgi:hypothetical protein
MGIRSGVGAVDSCTEGAEPTRKSAPSTAVRPASVSRPSWPAGSGPSCGVQKSTVRPVSTAAVRWSAASSSAHRLSKIAGVARNAHQLATAPGSSARPRSSNAHRIVSSAPPVRFFTTTGLVVGRCSSLIGVGALPSAPASSASPR